MFLQGFKIAIFSLVLLSLSFFVLPQISNAQSLLDSTVKGTMNTNNTNFRSSGGYAPVTQNTLTTTIGKVIKTFIGLLGTIFLILIIAAGWKWFISQGEAKKMEDARNSMVRAIIGLTIIISAYATTFFVFKQASDLSIVNSTGGGPDTSQP